MARTDTFYAASRARRWQHATRWLSRLSGLIVPSGKVATMARCRTPRHLLKCCQDEAPVEHSGDGNRISNSAIAVLGVKKGTWGMFRQISSGRAPADQSQSPRPCHPARWLPGTTWWRMRSVKIWIQASRRFRQAPREMPSGSGRERAPAPREDRKSVV